MTERENYVIHIYRGNDLLNSLGRVNLWLPQILSAIIELYPSPLHYPFLLHVLGLVIVFLFCLSIKISWSLGRHNPKEKFPQWPGSVKHVRVLCTVQGAVCAGKSCSTSALYPHFSANANFWGDKMVPTKQGCVWRVKLQLRFAVLSAQPQDSSDPSCRMGLSSPCCSGQLFVPKSCQNRNFKPQIEPRCRRAVPTCGWRITVALERTLTGGNQGNHYSTEGIICSFLCEYLQLLLLNNGSAQFQKEKILPPETADLFPTH